MLSAAAVRLGPHSCLLKHYQLPRGQTDILRPHGRGNPSLIRELLEQVIRPLANTYMQHAGWNFLLSAVA